MPVYRHIQISFWQDYFILNLTPNEKYFYLYLLTNSKTKQCGIYEIPLQVMELETGFKRDTVIDLIKQFEKLGKIKYSEENSEIMIINWIKYNWSDSNKVKICINKELNDVKTKEFVNHYHRLCEEYGYSMDISSERKRKIKRKIKRKEKEKSDDEDDDSIKYSELLLKKNFSYINPLIEVAKMCYEENGPNCRLKKGSHGIEEKCKYCPSKGKI